MTIDLDDEFVKAPGPVVVRRLPHELADEWPERPPQPERVRRRHGRLGLRQAVLDRPPALPAPAPEVNKALQPLPPFEWQPPAGGNGLKRTNLYDAHRAAGRQDRALRRLRDARAVHFGDGRAPGRAQRGRAVRREPHGPVRVPRRERPPVPAHHRDQRRLADRRRRFAVQLPAGARRQRDRRHLGLPARARALLDGGQRVEQRQGLGVDQGRLRQRGADQ